MDDTHETPRGILVSADLDSLRICKIGIFYHFRHQARMKGNQPPPAMKVGGAEDTSYDSYFLRRREARAARARRLSVPVAGSGIFSRLENTGLPCSSMPMVWLP